MTEENDDTPDRKEQPARASMLEPEARMKRLGRWYKESLPTVDKWRKEAEESYEFVDGWQWADADKKKLEDEGRPVITFNRLGPTVDGACGVEIGQSQEITCKQKGLEDAPLAEAATTVVEWVDDQCDAVTEESSAFRDNIIAGLGWVEMRIDDIGEPRVVEERIDPFEMVWDTTAKRPNFQDARYVFRAKSMALEAAREFFPDIDPDDLDCTWGDDDDASTGHGGRRHTYDRGSSDDADATRMVTIVECQWRELEQVATMAGPDGQPAEMPVEEAEVAHQRMTEMAMMAGMPPPPPPMPKKRWCVYQTFAGRKELQEPRKLDTGPDLGYQAQTGKWDRKQGIPYGIIRAAKDPQRYANKWMLQQMHILNTTAKNTLLYESGAFASTEEALKQWAQPGGRVEMTPGSIVNGRFQVVAGQGMQPVLSELMMFALDSIRQCTGINLEMLGQVAREQAGVLEQERKKAAVATLSWAFKNLTACRKVLGRMRLRLALSGAIPDTDLAEALGPEQAPLLPQLKGDPNKVLRFDVLVDESPSSPNAKERYWQTMQPILPAMMKLAEGGILPTEFWAELIRYIPVPSGMSEAMIQAMSKPKEPDPREERTKEAQTAEQEGKARERHASATLKEAQAQGEMIDMQKEMMTPIEDPNLVLEAKIAQASNGPPAG